MKIRWYLFLLIFPFLSCSLSFNDKDKDEEINVRLVMNYTGGFSLNDASYTFINLESGDEETGSLEINNETAIVFGDVDLEEGYWKGYITLIKEYDTASGTSFKTSTDMVTRFISKTTDEVWFNDPFSDGTGSLYAYTETSALSPDTADSVSVRALSKDGRNEYFFELRNQSGSEFSGQFDYIKEGNYATLLIASNPNNPDWTPWDTSRTITSPIVELRVNTKSVTSIYSDSTYMYPVYLSGHKVMDSSTFCNNPDSPDSDSTNLYEYDVFFPHPENGSYFYMNAQNLLIQAPDNSTPATLSLERYPMGQNRIVEFLLNYDSLYINSTLPIISLYYQESESKPENRVEVKFWNNLVEVYSVINNVDTTYATYPYTLTPGNKYSVFIKEGRLGIYENNSMITSAFILDPAIPEDLHLHLETFQTSTGNVSLDTLSIINNYNYTTPYLPAP